jgi:predicted TIM-barrel fold metal-dependent hydrolase
MSGEMNRRDFLKTAATTGIVFCDCGLLDAAHAQLPSGRHLPVIVKGKRVKTIDVHSHCYFRDLEPLLGSEAAMLHPPVNNGEANFIEVERRLQAMDGQGVDMEVLSINPFWYEKERDLAAQIVKIQNEKLAEFCASKPDRFTAFASLTLQAPDLAVEELETAIKKQGLRGRSVDTRVKPTGVERPSPKS